MPVIVLAQNADCTSGGLSCISDTVLSLINDVFVPLLFAIAFIVFLWGVFKTYIFSNGEQAEVAKGHKLVLWGIIGFVVMISIWGLVNVVSSTFGLEGSAGPSLPTTPSSSSY